MNADPLGAPDKEDLLSAQLHLLGQCAPTVENRIATRGRRLQPLNMMEQPRTLGKPTPR